MNRWYAIILILILLNVVNMWWITKHQTSSQSFHGYSQIVRIAQDEGVEQVMRDAHGVDDVFRMYNCGITSTPSNHNLIAFCRLTNFVMCSDIYKSLFSKFKSTTAVNILDKKTLKPLKEWKIIDDVKPDGDGFSTGIEDNRPFWHNGDLYSLGTLPQKGFGCKMVLIKWQYPSFEKEWSRVLPSPNHQKCEKNWGPLSKDGQLYFILSVNPMMVIEYDVDTNAFGEMYKSYNPDFPLSLRAGKYVAPYSSTHDIGMAHERINDYYYFYFFLFENSPPFQISKISKRFKCPEVGGDYFQYPNHAHFDGKDVILSFGLDDCGASLMRANLDQLVE